MKIGILGPSKPKEWYKLMKIKEKDYLEKIKYIANVIANKNHSIVVVPHKDSLSHIFAQYYIDFNGNKVIGVIPLEDTEFGYDYLDKEICDEIINAGTWRNVPETLDEHSDILLVLALGPGVFVEIGQTKWFKVNKIYVIKEFTTQPMHKELTYKLPIEEISLGELENKI